MSLYFGTNEITNIDNLVPQSGLDITNVWFGTTNVYTVWAVYEGTLPATFNANGSDMRQYQIYGADGGVGESTENRYDKNDDSMNFIGYVNNTNYTVVESTADSFSIIVPVEPNTTYTIVKPRTSRFRVCLFTSYPYAGKVSTAIYGDRDGNGFDYGTSLTFTASNDTSYILAFIRNYNDTEVTNDQMKNSTMVVKGSTVPTSFVPYGYKLDMSVKSGNLFDKNATDTAKGYVSGGYLETNGEIINNGNWSISEYIELEQNKNYVMNNLRADAAYCLYDSAKIYTSGARYRSLPTINFNSGNAKYTRISVVTKSTLPLYNLDILMLTPGTTPPDEYQSYSNTTTPIYIGDEPLEKDEYVDYKAGKVYRRTINYFDISAQTLIDVTGTGTMRTGVYLGFLAVGQYTLTFDAPHNNPLFITRKNGNTYTYQDVNKSQVPFTFLVNSGDEIIIRLGNTQTFEEQGFTNICVVSGTTPPEIYVSYYQPTDPPVAFPALPTCDGTTIVDYAGQSVATPEKVLFEYRKENF